MCIKNKEIPSVFMKSKNRKVSNCQQGNSFKGFYQMFLLVFVFALSLTRVHGQTDIKTENAFVVNRSLGRGINIPSIQNMNEKHYQVIKEAGFFNVRIPIAPFKEITSDTDFTLKSSFFERLDLAVERVLSVGLIPIIDFHEHHAMQNDPLGTAPMFYSTWTQIAEHYKDAPSEVLFEIANEPNMKPDLWNDLYKMAYRIIRKSNPERTLLIGTIYGNQIKFLKDLELPQDDRNIIVTVHYYMPIEFTHQGAEWNEKRKNVTGLTWPSEERTEGMIVEDFEIAQKWSEANNRPIHLGEFGVYNKTAMEDRIRWTSFVAREADARGWSWSYWEFNQGFGIYDLKTDEWKKGLKNALLPKNDK